MIRYSQINLSDRPIGAEHTLRRFWKTVNISSTPTDSFLINLDHRALKTPFGAKLEIPKERRLLAALIANEWENQDEVLKQHALPVVCAAFLYEESCSVSSRLHWRPAQ